MANTATAAYMTWLLFYVLFYQFIQGICMQFDHIMLCILAVASVTIDIERRNVGVIESQNSAEVCLVKSGTTLNSIIAMVATDEITDDVGSPRELYCKVKT